MKRSSSTTALLLICTFACTEARRSEPQRPTLPPAVAGADSAGGAAGGGGTDSTDSKFTERPPVDHCEQGGRSYKIGAGMYDAERCLSCSCQRSGWDCRPAFCNDAEKCNDGGVCDGCELGQYRFPVGERMLCDDGCNDCICTAGGDWLSTIQICDDLPLVQPCEQPPDADTTYPMFLVGERSLSLRAEFARGGCEYAPMRACYASSSAGGVRIWLEPEQPLADCEVPFIAEDVVSVAPLRDRYQREGREHGTIELHFARESLLYAF